MAYTKGRTGRGKGRPKKGQEPIKPQSYEEIVDLIARKGWSFESVAEKFNVTREALRRLYREKILPVQSAYIRANATDLVFVNLQAIRQEAMRQYWENAPIETKEQVAEIMGHGDKATMTRRMVERRFQPNRIMWLELAYRCDMATADLVGLKQLRVVLESDMTFRISGLNEEDVAQKMLDEVKGTLKLMEGDAA